MDEPRKVWDAALLSLQVGNGGPAYERWLGPPTGRRMVYPNWLCRLLRIKGEREPYWDLKTGRTIHVASVESLGKRE